MPMRRPKTVWVLLIFFAWVEGRQFFSIVFPSTSGSFLFYSALDLLWVHYLIAVGTVALCGWVIYTLWYARPNWLFATHVSLAVFATTSILTTWFSLQHLDLMRSTYLESRLARGLPVRDERLDAIVQPEPLIYAIAGMVLWYGVLALAAWRRRDYGAMPRSTAQPTT